jgi:hypothetical protein
MNFITKGIRLPPVIPMENSIVSGTSFPRLKILPAEDIRRGGIPEKPRPIIPTPIKIIILFAEKIATTNPTMLIMYMTGSLPVIYPQVFLSRIWISSTRHYKYRIIYQF